MLRHYAGCSLNSGERRHFTGNRSEGTTEGSSGRGCVEFKRKDFCIVCEVRIARENRPFPTHGHSAEKNINSGNCDAAGSAFIIRFGGRFIIQQIQRFVRKWAKGNG